MSIENNSKVYILIDTPPFQGQIFTVKETVIRNSRKYFLIDVGSMELMFSENDVKIFDDGILAEKRRWL